jgi:sulfite reductase alpha subunit-like flavoprotein
MTTERDESRTALILYGSETGNAQEVAEELGRTAERLHFVTHVGECDSVKAVGIKSKAKSDEGYILTRFRNRCLPTLWSFS